jgi:GNAT superfamily N-acetyltransferase
VRLLGASLADAFEGEPVTEWIGAQHMGRRSRRQLMFMLDLEVQVFPNGGSVVTVDDGQGGLAGVCLSLPPGRWAMPKSIDGRTTARFFRAYGFRLARVIRMQRAMAERHPSEPHYYYRWIGVRPRFRRQGLGSALMHPTLDHCDKEGLPAYLEASSELSAALYQRLGFVQQGVLQLPDGGPMVWPMWRPPRS